MPKTCTKCEVAKPLKDFGLDYRGGKSSWCRSCKAAYQREYVKERRASVEGKLERAKASRRHRLMYYGMVEGDYEDILEEQGGVCAGCGKPPKAGRALDIDHKHQPEEKKREPWERAPMVRGLLCHLCNRALGILADDPERLRRLADYLESPPAVPVMLKKFRRLTQYLENFESKREALNLK